MEDRQGRRSALPIIVEKHGEGVASREQCVLKGEAALKLLLGTGSDCEKQRWAEPMLLALLSSSLGQGPHLEGLGAEGTERPW